MFTVKPLVRKVGIRFTVRPMVRRFNSPVLERASFIKSRLDAGVSYQNAIREYDRKQKAQR